MANARKAIVDGLKESIDHLKEAVGDGINPAEVLATVPATQYFDMMKEAASKSGSNLIFRPSGASASPTSFDHGRCRCQQDGEGRRPRAELVLNESGRTITQLGL